MIHLEENVRRRDVPGEANEYYYTPRGVVAVISSWNFPLLLPTSMTAAALVTGNTVVLKPANLAGVVAAKLVEMLAEAELPAGVVNYVPGPGATAGKLLVTHPQVAMVAFTGSREVGRRVYQLAAETPTEEPGLRKVIAEMGGKNAIIIDSDADLDEAIKGVIASAFAYAGQKCSAASRVIVLAQAYERFVERLVEAMRTASVGPAEEPGTFVPPVIDQSAFESVRKYIEIGKSEACCALEVDVRRQIAESGGGYYIGPVIFTDVPPDARIAREEIFGPVLAVIKAADFDQAIRIFNGTDFALTGGVYSRSPANIERARQTCECGNLFINRQITGARVDLQPFGGFKLSGLDSKAGGPDYLIQFCEPRTITENTLRRGFAPSTEVTEQLV
jgi:RHH-type proline utilization regulon transcriptional repressor/proline dehydrogenase/delta 1-pyrroline-5-carboxylate dehydrogenase